MANCENDFELHHTKMHTQMLERHKKTKRRFFEIGM